jgi:hypothetical protein
MISSSSTQNKITHSPATDTPAEPVRVVDLTENLVLLRRIVKLLETSSAVDAANRQRITVDQFGATVMATGNGTATAGCPRVSIASDSLTGSTMLMDERQFMDIARYNYSVSIRSKLTFSSSV